MKEWYGSRLLTPVLLLTISTCSNSSGASSTTAAPRSDNLRPSRHKGRTMKRLAPALVSPNITQRDTEAIGKQEGEATTFQRPASWSINSTVNTTIQRASAKDDSAAPAQAVYKQHLRISDCSGSHCSVNDLLHDGAPLGSAALELASVDHEHLDENIPMWRAQTMGWKILVFMLAICICVFGSLVYLKISNDRFAQQQQREKEIQSAQEGGEDDGTGSMALSGTGSMALSRAAQPT
eukprot:gnl/MRDRNA2_/MRDRNA2_43943_c0_seq1.p1 gnl/MRDRNA2_/MRDRNA2_43943_c0~~gnl/MRDRNA2_/MRDRNA2_43943_c0_seq1.p1  ORF type:complete len:237 (-),score=26.62 gnl/MRDRNA2_/MRDRNA2_43943_c0_seq1:29-739(-)